MRPTRAKSEWGREISVSKSEKRVHRGYISGVHFQWRRQTIKLGSAFKGQLYFQVGQMEGPNVLSETRDLVRSVGAPSG